MVVGGGYGRAVDGWKRRQEILNGASNMMASMSKLPYRRNWSRSTPTACPFTRTVAPIFTPSKVRSSVEVPAGPATASLTAKRVVYVHACSVHSDAFAIHVVSNLQWRWQAGGHRIAKPQAACNEHGR